MRTRKTLLHLAVAYALFISYGAQAANTAEVPCRTTAECAEQARKIGATVDKSALKGGAYESQFSWLNRINKASIVMLSEEGIVSAQQGRRIAGGVQHVIDQAGQPDGKRPSDVLQLEQIMIDKIGPEASLIHSGRSRQDMYATYRLAVLRAQVLDYGDALNASRARLLKIAGDNVDTLIPAYTNGVQAMPISYAHYLLAFEAAFERDAQRIRELYARLNLSPMGTAVLANSGWPLNRERLAALLGFDGVRENSLDASQVSTYDIPLEAAGIASSSAIRVGALIGDIHTQYHQTRPWLLLDEGSTYTSSAMPQKRNPGLLMRTRESASDVVGLAGATTIRAHNVTTGMTDYKAAFDDLGLFKSAIDMFERLDMVLDALVINPERAMEELDADWTTSMELADTLEREHRVPFRIGHSFASLIVGQAREQGLLPKNFPYADAQALYTKAAQKYQWKEQRLPLSETAFRATLSPRTMVQTRKGTGGPQPSEVKRMLAQAQKRLGADENQMGEWRQRLIKADANLDKAFGRLVSAAR
ncbi:argininosuccinate lyase [Pseudomonas daroniae]|uniref:argininosuccinate lyase n=1 Tax=Phytopseudomonas daroniae TaxID=2487519 RepID=A0A4Q9QIT1_9GAMM|nr:MULTISPECIES: argininosuccinate lyase [Pseudomonas]TBU76545.1 argininosuccinate lyase [Pseudomonas daroniae]TBU80910.1 argininosuccinate lyase [Pseudomonas sp. FRB 228]TBU90148.1 argininosuccinate lyase [Pseudomonas daroniae]